MKLLRLDVDIAREDIVKDDVLDERPLVVLLVIKILYVIEGDREDHGDLLCHLVLALDEDDVLRFCAVADLAVGISSGGDGVRSIRDLVADTLAGLTDADKLAARDDDPVLIDDSDDAIHRVLHLVDNSLK